MVHFVKVKKNEKKSKKSIDKRRGMEYNIRGLRERANLPARERGNLKMKNLKEYLTAKRNRRIIGMTYDGLDIIYKFMSDEEKELLKSHKALIAFNGDLRDCHSIKYRYCLSWSEVRYIVNTFA